MTEAYWINNHIELPNEIIETLEFNCKCNKRKVYIELTNDEPKYKIYKNIEKSETLTVYNVRKKY